MENFRKGFRTPPITKQLRNILDQYPDDGQILKELIQNAEDAGATEIKFLLDHSSYGTDPKKLIHPDLDQFQGPALYAYNNAEFSDSDWDSIAMIMSSNKEDDPMKIGRFGMGFKAVYHMTDFPSLMSGDGIGFMDPHERYFKNDSHGSSSCSLWKFSDDSKSMKKRKHQFQPFCQHTDLFGITGKSFSHRGFKGKTLFRFPLRSSCSKQRSELSDNIYTPEKVHELFNDLKKDGGNLLLFLLHLQSIEVYEMKSDQNRNQPKRIIDIRIEKSCLELVTSERQRFEKSILNHEKSNDEPLCVSYPLIIESVSKAKGNEKLKTEKFILSLYHDPCSMGNEVKKVQESLKVLPWVGAAIRVHPGQSSSHGHETEGRIFSFLPLPLAVQSLTGLKCHVHGYFVLDQNRRSLKWPDKNRNCDSISDRHHIWNVFMVEKLVPLALVQMAVFISKLRLGQDMLRPLLSDSGCENDTLFLEFQMKILQHVMPDDKQVNLGWKPLLETFYQELVKHEVFYSKARNGIWLRIFDENTIVDNFDDDSRLAEILRKILLNCNRNLVSVPGWVIAGIEQHNSSRTLRKIQPDDICECLRMNSVPLSDEEKVALLNYLLKNLNERNELEKLIGLPLLQLDNLEWKNFKSSFETDDRVYIESPENPQNLLPGLNSFFLRNHLQRNEVLRRIAKSGTTQLKILDKESVLKLLCRVPGLRSSSEEGFTGKVTTIKNANCDGLSMNWFQRLWRYIEKHCIADLSVLNSLELYLIPFNKATELALLCRNVPLISWKSTHDERLGKALKNLNVILLHDLPQFILQIPKIMGEYVLKSNLQGIFEALNRIRANEGEKLLTDNFKGLCTEEKIAFIEYIAKRFDSEILAGIGCKTKQLLQMLPCFRTLDESGFKKQHFVSLKDVPRAVSFSFSLPFEVPTEFIKLEDCFLSSFQKQLDIQTYSKAQVLCKFIFPEINKEELDIKYVEKVMKYCLDNLDVLQHSLPKFKETMSKVRFLSVRDQKGLKMPSQLFDDSNEHVKELFCDLNVFPTGEFSKQSYRAKLKTIGLKGSEEITNDDFLSAANKINSQAMSRNISKKATALQVLLNAALKSGKIMTNDAINKLNSLRWLLPNRYRPIDYPERLDFVGEKCSLLSPHELILDKYSHIVGSVKATVDMKNLEYLVNSFDLEREPSVKDVIRHLDNIVSLSCPTRKTNGKRRHSEQIPLPYLDKKVKRICEMVYEFLNERAAQNQVYLASLFENNYIFINGHFMKGSLCALQSQLCFPPYVSGLPNDLAAHYKDLWSAMKIRKQFDVKSYMQIIETIFSEYGQQPLSKEVLDMVLKIINECTSVEDESQQDGNIQVYLPDHRNILRPVSELYFNDTCWLSKDPTDGTPLCHPRVAPHDAKKLGVASWRQKTLQLHKKQLPGQKFGQKVKLVNRLKRILEGYPLDEGILKELVQNADDAGATKIHFIKDSRILPNKRIFDEKWEPLQRCSLSVYNDKPFSKEDLEGIQCLGEGSKSKERTKIGKYGIGFNCIYNLTDVPTFLTNVDGVGRVLCVMDPTLQYVEGSSEDSPGFMFDKIQTLSKTFPDVFSGYLEEHYGVSGTVFRFPLRMKESPISNRIVTEKILDELFENMKEEIESCLIFLKNVREIVLMDMGPEGKIQSLFRVTATLKEADQKQLDEFQINCKMTSSELDEGHNLNSVKEEVRYVMETKDSDNIQQEWLIVQRLGFTDNSFLNENHRTYVRETQDFSLLPLAGVAYPIKQKVKSNQMKLFCFLPLPKTINLPVHVNGHFALDSENRRSLWEHTRPDYRSEWNDRLLSDVAAEAYCSLILAINDLVNREISNSRSLELTETVLSKFEYGTVFPDCRDSNERCIHLLVKSVYEILWRQNSPILPVYSLAAGSPDLNIVWMGSRGTDQIKPCFDLLETELEKFFAAPTHGNQDQNKRAEKELREVLISFGFPLVHSSCNFHYNFHGCGISVQCSNPDYILQFFADFKKTCGQLDLPCYLQETPFQCVLSFKTVLMFCSHAEGFKDFVRQTPFLLTQDEVLRQFENSALPFYIDRYTVAPHALQKFAHAEIRDILRSANMTQEFTVAGFISILPPLLPENIFHRSDKIVAFETFSAYLQNYSYMKSPEKLLQDIWKFLESRIKPSDYEILKEWCLLPVTTNGCDRLLPLTKAGTVIIGSQVEESFDPNLRDSLSEIGMSMLNETYVSPTTLAKFPNCKIHLSVAIIQYLITCKEHSFVLGKHSDCLLKFLSHHIEHWKYVQGAAGAVKCLPIFKYFDGRTGNLMQSECYIVPETVPNEEAIKWTAENSALFLASKFEISGLLQWIQCKHIKEDCLYSQFIFKKFHKLSPDGRLQHLMFVKDHLMKHVPRSQILCNSLKNLKFLSSSDSSSELRTASTFYDWNVEIFKIMQPPSDFPSQPFRNYEWLEFLKLCDLISKVTEEHLLRYANEVSKKTARGDFDEPVCKKAKLLVTNVMELDDLSTRFSNALKTMPIVQAVVVPKQLSMLHPQKIIENGSFVGFKSSLESRHTDYAWTTSDLLPTWATRKRKLLEKLEVCDKPSGATVAQHLFNLCSSFVNKPQGTEAKEIFCRIVKKIYKLLSDKEISKEDVGCLNNSRCIIINAENELAMADQVVINLPEENVIEPYLYSLPSELYEYVNFFLKIQVEKELQIEHYIRVLGRVFQKVGKTEPIPNDRRIVLKAFAGLLNQLRGRKEVADLKELILPSENGKLYNSSELVIKDDISLANRICRFEGIKFLIDLNELKDFGLNDADYKIFEKLAPHLRPPLLSDVVLQKMETASELNEEICSKSNKIWKTISAPQFSDGIKCLLTSKADLIGAVIEDKLKNLSKLQVYDVPSIVTYLEYQQKRIPGSELDSNFHITDIGADLIKVYISEKLHDIKDSQMLTTKLACLVNELLDGALLPVLVNVPPLFLCKPDEIVSTLCELGFQSVGSSKSARATPYLPKLGQFVPITMHHMLQQGFSSFKRGDLVALEYGDDLEDSVYIMVEIIEAISSGTSSSLNANYRVKTGDDTEQIVNCSVLYEFCSPLSFDEDGALIPSQTTDAQDSTPVHDEIPQLKDIIRDIKRTLIESRTLSEDQRRRVIKRLYLRWHPDKNSTELSDLCTKIVQILQKLIENINNLSSEEDDDEGTDFPDGQFHTSQHTRYRSSQSSSRGSDHDRSHGSASGGTFNFNFNFWDETARGHKKQYEEYRNQKSSYGHSAFQNRDFSFRQPNPQPQEARRWMRQGEYDLESAEHDRTKQFFEWSCYKYHQAAEKALKAIQFNIDANQQFTHSLSSLCSGIVDKSVLESIRKLEQIIPNPAAMRYPNSHNYPKVPHDVYSAETTAEVASLASEIVQFAKRIIRERNT